MCIGTPWRHSNDRSNIRSRTHKSDHVVSYNEVASPRLDCELSEEPDGQTLFSVEARAGVATDNDFFALATIAKRRCLLHCTLRLAISSWRFTATLVLVPRSIFWRCVLRGHTMAPSFTVISKGSWFKEEAPKRRLGLRAGNLSGDQFLSRMSFIPITFTTREVY